MIVESYYCVIISVELLTLDIIIACGQIKIELL